MRVIEGNVANVKSALALIANAKYKNIRTSDNIASCYGVSEPVGFFFFAGNANQVPSFESELAPIKLENTN